MWWDGTLAWVLLKTLPDPMPPSPLKLASQLKQMPVGQPLNPLNPLVPLPSLLGINDFAYKTIVLAQHVWGSQDRKQA